MQGYELLYVLKPDLAEEKVTEVQEKIKDILTKNKAHIVADEVFGKKELAYPIKKFKQGYYLRIEFEADGKALKEMDRFIGITDTIIRKLCVKLESIREKNKEKEPVA